VYRIDYINDITGCFIQGWGGENKLFLS